MSSRKDFTVTSIRKVDRNTVKLVISFLSNLGAPVRSEVQGFFTNFPEFNLVPDSAKKVHAEAITVLATRKIQKREATDRANMQPVIAGLTYLDSDMGNVWKLEKDDAGKTVLHQMVSQDVVELIKERVARMNRAVAGLTIEVNATVPIVSVGDKVKFWDMNKSNEGVIQGIEGAKVIINTMGTARQFDIHSIYKIVDSAPAQEKMEENNIKDYYTEVFGPEFASDMVKRK